MKSPQPDRFGLLLLFAAFICTATLVSAQATPTTTASRDSTKFLRFVPDDKGGGVLQTSVVTYRNRAGVTVDLIGAVHLAEPSYFHDLDKSFEQYDALLYEMVKPKDYTPPEHIQPSTRPVSLRQMGWVTLLQRFLKENLGLAFQLEEINYARPNFVHADMDVDTFLRRQEERGESIFTLMLQQIMREMSRQQPAGYQPGLGDLLLAMQSPDRQRQIKLILAREFDQMEDVLSGLDGPDGSVIIAERNNAALKVLKERIARGDKKIGIFYGAGHLKGMEKILTQDMGFQQVGEPKWRVAWDMTAKNSDSPTTKP